MICPIRTPVALLMLPTTDLPTATRGLINPVVSRTGLGRRLHLDAVSDVREPVDQETSTAVIKSGQQCARGKKVATHPATPAQTAASAT